MIKIKELRSFVAGNGKRYVFIGDLPAGRGTIKRRVLRSLSERQFVDVLLVHGGYYIAEDDPIAKIVKKKFPERFAKGSRNNEKM